MSDPAGIKGKNQDTATWRGILRWAIKQTVYILLLAAALFLSVGGADWWQAWAVIALAIATQALTAALISPTNPELLVERSQMREGFKRWDIGLAVLVAYSPHLISIVAGLEWRYTGGASFPLAVALFALAAQACGSLFTLWAVRANRFFSGVVRIQHERGHTVATGGPYRYIRHPGYAGIVVYDLSFPLLLGSSWAFIPAILVVGVILLRTRLEDQTLITELPGYAEYARQVRYRLLPGVW